MRRFQSMTQQQRIERTLETYGFRVDTTAKARGRKVYRHHAASVNVAFIVGRSLRHFTCTHTVGIFARSVPTSKHIRSELIVGELTQDVKTMIGLPTE